MSCTSPRHPFALLAVLAAACGGSTATTDGGVPDGPGIVVPADASEVALAAATVDAQGRVVVAGTIARDGATDVAVLRFAADGTPDTAFGTGGVARVDLSDLDVGYGVVVDGQGRILVAGETGRGGTPDALVARLLPDGTLDASFGAAGVAVFALSTFSAKIDRATAIALDAAGRAIVAAVMDVDQGAREDFAVLRLADDGSLDPSFGTNGVARVTAASNDFASFVRVTSDTHIVVGGSCNQQVCLAQLDSTGALDPTFGTSGRAVLSAGAKFQRATAAAQDASGRWVIAGQAVAAATGESDLLVLRTTATGAFDVAFATTGYAVLATGHDALARAVAVEADGHVVVAGDAHDGHRWTTVLARFADDGTADAGVGPAGWRTQDVAPGSHAVAALVTTPAGLALAGTVDGMAFVSPLSPTYTPAQLALPLALPFEPATDGADRPLVDGQLFASSLATPFSGNHVTVTGRIAPVRGTPTAIFVRANELAFSPGASITADGQDGQAPLGAVPGAGGEGGSGGGTGGVPHSGVAGSGGSFGRDGGAVGGGTPGRGWASTYAGARLWGRGGGGGIGTGCCPPIVPSGGGTNGAGGGGGGMWDDLYTPGGGGGGGLVVLVANAITGPGTITARGGGGLGDANGGRSGGGGGGVLWIATRSYDGQLQADVSGGSTTTYEPGRPGTARIFQITTDGKLVERAFTDTW